MRNESALAAYGTAPAYRAAERARLLLAQVNEPELAGVSRAAGEAAYYLSDSIPPDDRLALLAAVEADLAGGRVEHPVSDALNLLGSAGEQTRRLLQEPGASGELGMALQALSHAVATLTSRAGRRLALRH